jgi:hypothetical protein
MTAKPGIQVFFLSGRSFFFCPWGLPVTADDDFALAMVLSSPRNSSCFENE